MRSEAQTLPFTDPPWDAPLDADKAKRAVPADATIAGMFMAPMADNARKLGRPLPSARERYTGFKFYPLTEHVQLLLEASEVLFPGVPTRIALRKLGRAAPPVMLESTVGKVTLGVVDTPCEVIANLCNVLSSFLRPSSGAIEAVDDRSCIVRLSDIHYFLDCHHVGVFEGAMRLAGVEGRVQLCMHSATRADLLCTW